MRGCQPKYQRRLLDELPPAPFFEPRTTPRNEARCERADVSGAERSLAQKMQSETEQMYGERQRPAYMCGSDFLAPHNRIYPAAKPIRNVDYRPVGGNPQ